jgi:hypothetical protein
LEEDWKHYFETRHEGLGTTYERFVLHGYFRRIRNRYDVRTVLEAPAFGMTGISGINSMWWAMEGAQVTLVDHSSVRLDAIKKVWQEISLKARLVYDPGTYASLLFEDKEFDMSWNFAALHPELKLEVLLRELIRVTRKVIFICVPNRMNPFNRVCSMLKGRGKVVQLRGMDPGTIKRIMRNNGWQVKDKGFLDVPPWPDIAMSKEDLFRKIGLKQYARHLRENITEKSRICILDYYSGRNKKMKREMGRYGFLENSPNWLKTIWAHHRYFVFAPRHLL